MPCKVRHTQVTEKKCRGKQVVWHIVFEPLIDWPSGCSYNHIAGLRRIKVSHRHGRPQEANPHFWLLRQYKRMAQKTSEGFWRLSLGWWMQIPVRDEVSSEDAAQYLINPVTGAYHRMP